MVVGRDQAAPPSRIRAGRGLASLAAAIALVSLANVWATGDAFNPIGFLWAATTLLIVIAIALPVALVQRWR